MAIRSNKPLIIVLTLLLLSAIGATVWGVIQLRRPLEARENPTVLVVQPSEEMVSRNSQVEFFFDQKMDHESVLNALAVEPSLSYDTEWYEEGDGERLLLTPTDPLESEQTYRVILSTMALNQEGRPLDEAVAFSLTTSREIEVIEVLPAAASEMVALNESITVRFDQPVELPAESLSHDEPEARPLQIVLDPATPGVGQWLDEQTYRFFPTAPLQAGTAYQVTLTPMIMTGLELKEAYQWSFVTEGARVRASFPFNGAVEVGRSSDVRLQFAQPMDAELTQASFELTQQGETDAVQGEFVWEDEQSLRFQPDKPLAMAATYEIQLSDQASTPGGVRGRASPYRASFTTVEPLQVASVQPVANTVEVALVPTDTLIAVQFNRPVVPLVGLTEKEALPIPITIEPALKGEGEWVSTRLFAYRPVETLIGSREYTVTVRDDVVDSLGASLQEPFSWTFTTEYPRALQLEPLQDPDDSLPPIGLFEAEDDTSAPSDISSYLIASDGPISIRFNQAMQPTASEAALTLSSADGTAVAGQVEWQDNDTLLQFFPTNALTAGETYRVSFAAGAPGATGGETRETFERPVTVAPPLEVVERYPSPGEEDVQPQVSILIGFNAPIEAKNLKSYIQIEPEAKQLFTSYNPSARQLYLSFGQGLQPDSAYKITISADLPDLYGGTLGQDYQLSFTTGALPPYLALASNRVGGLGTLNPAVTPIQVVDSRNLSQLDFSLYRLSEAEMQRIYNQPAWQQYTGNPAQLVSEWSVTPSADANEGTLAQIELPLAPEERRGLYFLYVTTPDRGPSQDYTLEDKVILLFSPLNLTIKQAPDEMVVWATDMQEAQPQAKVDIQLVDIENYELIGEGQTDEQGLLRLPLPSTGEPNGNRSFMVMSYQADGTLNSIARPDWVGEAGPWAFGYNTEWVPLRLYGSLYTERPIYRPGHTIYYKGVLRERDGRDFKQASIEKMEARLEFQGEIVASQEVEVGPFGTFHGSFTLDEEAPTGFYYLKLWQEEIGYCFPSYCFWESIESQIQVAEYERPTFEVDVQTNQSATLQGETAQATVLATYYAGGALSDAPVRWNQFSRDYYFDVPALAGYWSWQDNDGGAARGNPFESLGTDPLAKNGSTTLDESGAVTLPLATDLTIEDESESNGTAGSRTLIIEAEVTDLDERVISGRSEMVVHAGEFYIGLRPEGYLGQVERASLFHVATADIEGNLQGAREVTIEFYQREWNYESSGFGLSRNPTFTDTLMATQEVTTEENGRATVNFTPQAGGSYTVLARGRDQFGHEIRSRAYFWVIEQSQSSLWGITDDNKMELTADKKSYQVGDVAKILLPTNMAGMTALISQELFGVEALSVETLATTAEVIEIPITEEMVPNVYLSVVALSGTSAEQPAPEFRMGYLNLEVSTASKALQLYVTPSERESNTPPQPGETVTFNVRTQDANQQPVAAEVSLAMVDKGVLALAEDNQISLMEAFYRQRPLAVRTGASLAVNIDRLNDEVVADGSARTLAGGGGGGGGDGGPSSLRSNILDTAYWQADIVTDAQGEAEVTITLPDNITTWTLIAKAVSESGPLVGEYEGDLLSTKPLLIAPNLPRFLVIGDEADIPVIIQNNTSDVVEAEVHIETTDLTIRDDQATKSVRVPPNGRQVVIFSVLAKAIPTVLGTNQGTNQGQRIKVAFRVEGAGLSDGIEKRLPLYEWVSPDIVASSGVIQQPEEALIETIQLPESSIPSQGGLTVELLPSLAGVTEATGEWFESYPYQNTEAVASRLLVNAATLQALDLLQQQSANPERAALQDALSSEIAAGAKLLAEWQNEDGGWAWWSKSGDSPSRPWLTAYTLFALHKSQIVALNSTSEALAQAIPYVQTWLDNNPLTTTDDLFDRHAFMLYVLSEMQQDGVAQLDANQLNQQAQALFKQRTPNLTSHDGQVFLLMALINADAPEEMRRTLTSELLSHARLSATGSHWEESSPNFATFDSSLRSTALAIQALSRLQAQNPEDNTLDLLPQSVRWLMNARQNGHWESTQDSAWAVLALTEYMQASGELEANFDYQVALNEEVLKSGQATPENLTDAMTLEIAIADLLQNEANQLGIMLLPPSSGEEPKGQLYYSTWLRTYLPVEELEATNQGIHVARQYESVDANSLQSTGAPIESVAVGDLVQVRIRVDAPNSLHFFTLEDPIPAGFEVVDPSLLTTPANASGPTQIPITESQSRFYYNQWSQKIIRDEKVALFSDLLPSGSYEYTYLLRATTAGTYHALPTLAYETYHPEVFGRSKGEEVVVGVGR